MEESLPKQVAGWGWGWMWKVGPKWDIDNEKEGTTDQQQYLEEEMTGLS